MLKNHIYNEEIGILMTDLKYIEPLLKKIQLTPEVDVEILQQEFKKLHFLSNQATLIERHEKLKNFVNKPITLGSLNDINLMISKREKSCPNQEININPNPNGQFVDENTHILQQIKDVPLKKVNATVELVFILNKLTASVYIDLRNLNPSKEGHTS